MVASTNHLDKLDPGLSSRPSRFDRKYKFALPTEDERKRYCEFWRARLKKKEVDIEFPMKICPAMALITHGFSFAYLQEAFVASLLAIAQGRTEDVDEETERPDGKGDDKGGHDDDDKDLDEYELWREIKKTVELLREDMGNALEKPEHVDEPFSKAFALEKEAQAPPAQASSTESSSTGQSSDATQQRCRGLEKRREEMPCVRGRTVSVDHKNVPIISDEGDFIYSDRDVNAQRH